MLRSLWTRTIVLVLAVVTSVASAESGSILLNAFPNIGVADGRSNLTITAEIRSGDGSLVPDGTQVVFESTLGMFRESLVRTTNGHARGVLIAGNLPGIARVRASALRYGAISTLEVEFVTDRSVLSSRRQFIEVVSDGAMFYSPEYRTIEASAPGRGVTIVYRDIRIEADDVQILVPAMEVKARRAKLTAGGVTTEFGDLTYHLNLRRGTGITVFHGPQVRFAQSGRWPSIAVSTRPRLGAASVVGAVPSPAANPLPPFSFTDLSHAVSIIESKKAVVFPGRQIQFHRANIVMAGTSVLRLPLFQINAHDQNPLVTEQFFNVSNNEIAINYPHYLSLRPGETSLLRFRYGNRMGTGLGATSGLFLDYELHWNRGPEMDGGLIVSGLLRDDWGAQLRQYWQLDDYSTLSAQLDFPAHRSFFGNANLSRAFEGFQVDLNASATRTLTGAPYSTSSYGVVVETTPTRTRFLLPGRIFFGLTGSESHMSGEDFEMSAQRAGVRMRSVFDPIRWNNLNINASYTANHFTGTNRSGGFSQELNFNLSTTIGRSLFLSSGYQFVDDRFSSAFLGRHRLSTEAYFTQGPWSVRGFLAQSLDVERLSGSLSMNFRISPLWRVYYGYWMDSFQGDNYMDQVFILGYRLGFREIGLSFSHRTGRIGIDLLGTTFN